MIGEPLRLKRCLALGYFVPVNSKKPDSTITQRRESAKLRLSDLKLNTGPALGRGGGQPKRMRMSSTPLPAARSTGPMSPMRTSPDVSSADASAGLASSSASIALRYCA
jgi:hypothetical protein